MDWEKDYPIIGRSITLSDVISITQEMFVCDNPSERGRFIVGINHLSYGEGSRNLSQLRKAKMNASKTANILKEIQGWKPKVKRKR